MYSILSMLCLSHIDLLRIIYEFHQQIFRWLNCWMWRKWNKKNYDRFIPTINSTHLINYTIVSAMISSDNIQYNNVINSIFVWQRSSPPFSVLSDEIGLNSSLELEWICNHKEVLLQKLMCLWFVKYTWLFVYQALCTVIICTTYFYIKHQMMRLLDEREILFWEYFEKLRHNCRKVEINFSLWFSWLVMYITRELNIVIWLEFLLK